MQTTEKKQQKALLKTATDCQIRILSEIVLNLLAGNIPISEKTKQNLKKHKEKLRKLSDRKSSVITLRKLWNKFPVDSLQTIIKLAVSYLEKI